MAAPGEKELRAALRWLGSPVPGSRRALGAAVPWWAAVGGATAAAFAVAELAGANGQLGGAGGAGGGAGGDDAFGGRPVDEYAARDLTQAGQCDATAKPGTVALRAWLVDAFGEPKSPGVQNILRDCSVGSPSEHWEGRAYDFMVQDLDQGQQIVDALTASDQDGNPNALARRAGVMYMIFNERMWRAYQQGDLPPGSWGPYTGPNPHTDHVHISLGWPGAMGGTSLYESGVAPLSPPSV